MGISLYIVEAMLSIVLRYVRRMRERGGLGKRVVSLYVNNVELNSSRLAAGNVFVADLVALHTHINIHGKRFGVSVLTVVRSIYHSEKIESVAYPAGRNTGLRRQ